MKMLPQHSIFAVAFLTAVPGICSSANSADNKKPLPHHYWRGGYFGPAFSLYKLQNTYDPAKAPGIRKLKAKGKAIGLIAGYNFLHKDFMYGLEADVANGSLFDDDLSFISTFRARLGKPLGYSLPYVTGGLALGGLKKSAAKSPLRTSKTQFGLVVGTGFEHVLANAITGRLEYTYGHFFSNGHSSTLTARLKSIHMFRASVAIHLND